MKRLVTIIFLLCLPACNLVCNSAEGIAVRTLDPDNVIYNYEWFHLRLANVRALDTQIQLKRSQLSRLESTLGSRDTWSRTDRSDYSQTETELLGLQAQRASIVQEYNAHVNMANRDLFRDNRLPSHLE